MSWLVSSSNGALSIEESFIELIYSVILVQQTQRLIGFFRFLLLDCQNSLSLVLSNVWTQHALAPFARPLLAGHLIAMLVYAILENAFTNCRLVMASSSSYRETNSIVM